MKKEGLYGEGQITDEHVKNNQDVRNLLAKSNILPEDLPPEEDIKKLERQLRDFLTNWNGASHCTTNLNPTFWEYMFTGYGVHVHWVPINTNITG